MIELRDCRLKDIQTDNYFNEGCETCNYGSEYVNQLELLFNDNSKTTIEISQMYDFSKYSYGDLMKLILNSVEKFKFMSKEEFIEFVTNDIKRKTRQKYVKTNIRVV